MSDDIPTSSWRTAWDSFNTPRLWAMVQDEDDPIGRQQVTAWRALAGSVRRQRQALQAARDELAAAWPPEQNESSAAFVTELDTLIARLDGASMDADTTATGLDRIMNALQAAKVSIEPLWEQYKDKSDDLTPNWFDRAEDELDEQARQHMIGMELAVQDAAALLRVPPPYRLTIEEGAKWPPSSDFDGVSHGYGYGGSGLLGVTVPHDPVPPLPGQDPFLPDGVQDAFLPDGVTAPGVAGGPDLAGVITPAPLPAPLPGDVGVVGTPPAQLATAGGPLPLGPLPVAAGGPSVGGGGSLSASSASAGSSPALLSPGASLSPSPLPGGGASPSPAALPVAGGVGAGAAAGGTPLVPGLMPGMGGGLGRAGGAARFGSVGAPGRRRSADGGSTPGPGDGPGLRAAGVIGGTQGRVIGGDGVGGTQGAPTPRAARSRRADADGSGRAGAGRSSVGGSTPEAAGGGRPALAGAGGGSRISGGGEGRSSARSRRRTAISGGSGGSAAEEFGAPRPSWLPDEPVGADRHLPGAPGGLYGTRRAPAEDDYDSCRLDQPWAVAQGVSPVIAPAGDNARHDPGPNVIGYNR